VTRARLLLLLLTLSTCCLLAFACRSLPPEAPSADAVGTKRRAGRDRTKLSSSLLSPARVLLESHPAPPLAVPTRQEHRVDRLFGVEVADPYRWLETGDDPQVVSWVTRQNELVERTLSKFRGRDALGRRLGELMEIGSISLPSVKKTRAGRIRLFYTRRDAKQNHPVLYVRDGLDGEERALVDPNAMGGAEHTTALDWWVPSEEGEWLAYGLSDRGSEDSVLHVLDVASGRPHGDVIPETRHVSLAWAAGGRHFYYSRYPNPGSVPAADQRYYRKLYRHELGRPPAEDPLVFGAELDRTDYPNCALSPNGRWLAVTVGRGWSESHLYLSDRSQRSPSFSRISPKGEFLYTPLPQDDALYVMTNEGAPRYRIFRVDPRAPERSRWQLVIPEHELDVLSSFDLVGGELLLSYLHRGSSRLERFDLKGKSLGAIPLPVLGANDGFSGLPSEKIAFYSFESFAVPPTIRALDLSNGHDRLWQSVKAPIRAEDFVVETHHARSRDGTAVPYATVRQRDVDPRSGDNPTLLYGYGGFNVNLLPRFSRSSHAFLERGGVYVQANARGGGELGENWHRAGQLEHKQNTFDDFIAVAEALIQTGITRPERLAIHGRSNGGLLVAAAITQRPELFRAAVLGVPLTDMVRYPRFLIARLWVPEYGDPDDEAQFRALYAYSPYHRVRSGTAYPSVLVTTAESDTRVDPLHARKFVAALQGATSSTRPVLLRTERSAGHGAGTPVSKQVRELTDIYSFVFDALGVDVLAQRSTLDGLRLGN
jgi:prolyl oligopeptidase